MNKEMVQKIRELCRTGSDAEIEKFLSNAVIAGTVCALLSRLELHEVKALIVLLRTEKPKWFEATSIDLSHICQVCGHERVEHSIQTETCNGCTAKPVTPNIKPSHAFIPGPQHYDPA